MELYFRLGLRGLIYTVVVLSLVTRVLADPEIGVTGSGGWYIPLGDATPSP